MKRNEHRQCTYVDLVQQLYTTFDLVVLEMNDVLS
jgi:hypothetical protein